MKIATINKAAILFSLQLVLLGVLATNWASAQSEAGAPLDVAVRFVQGMNLKNARSVKKIIDVDSVLICTYEIEESAVLKLNNKNRTLLFLKLASLGSALRTNRKFGNTINDCFYDLNQARIIEQIITNDSATVAFDQSLVLRLRRLRAHWLIVSWSRPRSRP